ncbi:HdeD family acid-resistance protein [Nocardioides sp. NPDC058538]|uniref:HdeD family acid-resistance protein n=1 Tax=Nocardioides sp. NPDC058538 TaxID=3346542 RepID=UPI00364718DC
MASSDIPGPDVTGSEPPGPDVRSSGAGPDQSSATPAQDRPVGSGSVFEGLGDYWGLVLAYGLVTTALGVILAVWPKQTLVVLAVIIAIQIIVSGVFRLIAAVAGSSMEGGLRAVVGFSGALAIVVGLLFLRDPIQTLLIVTILLGVWWVIGGIVDIIGAVLRPAPGRRMWDIATGAITVLAGAVLLINPEVSLGALLVVSCIWLIVVGLIAIVMAFRLRSEATS